MIAHLSTRSVATMLLAAAASFTSLSAQEDPLLQRGSASRAKGLENAQVFVYEFADFQCPHCARFAIEVFPRIDSAFVRTGKVHWIFVNLPLHTHPNAWLAHEAAVCAGAIADKFWAMHDRLFATQLEWGTSSDPGPVLARIARDAGVPAERFADCTSGDRVSSLLLRDITFAINSRVNGTPAFNINNEQSVVGLKSFEEWKDMLERILKTQSARKN
jgi:protein-disulfide isomerase